nr:unnamed protein product [Callosobruchus chinensis]
MNSWSIEEKEKACVLTSMPRDSAAAILENLSSSDLRSKITSALKLRFGDAHLTELLHGQLHNHAQQAKKDLTTFAYELKKAESKCAQVKDKNATLRQMIAQLGAESASKNKNGTTTAEAEKARIKENKSKLRKSLAQLEAENKKPKSDLSNALDDVK